MMNENVTAKDFKQGFVDKLLSIDIESYQLDSIDLRLHTYVSQVCNSPENHNLYEILALLKFFRLMDNYVFRPSKVKRFVKLYESLKFSGMDGRRCYKLTPIQ